MATWANSSRAGQGILWSVGTQATGTAIRLGSTLILTRLLAPEAYATMGLALVVFTTLEWLSDVGLIPGLLRQPEGHRREWLLVAWWINLGRGALLSGIAAFLATPLAAWYSLPLLADVIAILAFRPLLHALRSPGVPLWRRELNFRAVFLDEVLQAGVGAVTCIGLSWFDPSLGAKALAWGVFAGTMAGVALSYVQAPMAPHWHWDRAIARNLAGFGGAVFLNTLSMALWLNLDRLLGGQYLPLQKMGLYVVAWNLANAAEAIVTRGTDVYLSVLVRQSPDGQSSWHHTRAQRTTRWLGPLMASAIATAPLVIRLLYDPRYHLAGMVFALLVARLAIRAVGQIDFQFLLAVGRIRGTSLANAVAAAFQLALMIPLAVQWGLLGFTLAAVGSTLAWGLTQAIASADLGRAALLRLLSVTGWATAGILVAATVDTLITS